MATTLAPPAVGERIVLQGVSWELYERLLRELADQHVHLTYDSGSLELMAPLPEHESWKKVIGGFVEILALECDIPMARRGSTTLKRKDLAKGLEPDECYYTRHEGQVRGKKRLDLPRNPPPDLVVEIDITHRALDRERIYAALGVPEIWRFDGERLEMLALQKDRTYKPRERSLAFPWLATADLARFLRMLADAEETSVLRAFRDWVRARRQ